MTKILGLDLGTNSIGWAVVENTDDQFQLLDKGVRIFQEGVKIDKGIEGSKAAERTGYRSARRIKFRRKIRKINTLKALSNFGYCPTLTAEELNKWRYEKVYPNNELFREWWLTDNQANLSDRIQQEKNPYYYRYLCLNKKLNLDNETDRHFIGRAFYHMAQRRGFLSNRLDKSEDDEIANVRKQLLAELNKTSINRHEIITIIDNLLNDNNENKKVSRLLSQIKRDVDKTNTVNDALVEIKKHVNKKENLGEVKGGIVELSEEMNGSTLGEYFYEQYRAGNKIRDKYTHREEHYLDEFNRICEYQNIPEELKTKLHNAIFYQRPLRSQKGLVGKCVFEPKKPRCAVSRPDFEEYRMMCFINNIKIQTPDDEKLRVLTDAEKLKIKPAFFRKSKEHFDFIDLAKELAHKKQCKFYKTRDKHPEDTLFNFAMNTSVSGCPVSARFKSIFGKEFISDDYTFVKDANNNLAKNVIDAWHVLFTFDSDEKLKQFAQNKLELNEEQIKEFLKIHLKQDYASLSLKAIRKIVPFLNSGLIYSHAVFMANMDAILPKEVWQNESDRKLVQNEILNIIETQNEEKQIIDIVNGVIKRNRDENATWSEEAKELYRKDLYEKIASYFGANRYASFAEEKKNRIEENTTKLFDKQMQKNMGIGEFAKVQRIDDRVREFVINHWEVDTESLNDLYHPSAIDVYKPPVKGDDGRLYLGSPLVSSIKNPMAMRALHQLRKVINELLRNDIIDANTKINIEMARDLKNANERKAWQEWQNERQKKRKDYAAKIQEHFDAHGINAVPSSEEILKYELWEEQKHKCVYTGRPISLSQFIGSDPEFDIEHTIPRSLSFDNSMANKTLCESRYNRYIKRNKIPYQLPEHQEFLQRIEHWKENAIELDKQIKRAVAGARNAADKDQKDRNIKNRHKLSIQRNYWNDKYNRFQMKDVPEGFKNSQMVDTGIINKYSRMYLNTLFNKVYTVKGNTVADFRKFWGLQDIYEKKERVNHIHHCIDAIVIACITKNNYEALARFYHNWEEAYIAGSDEKPNFDKPWDSFTSDVKNIENEVLISHYTADNLPKQSKKVVRKRGIKQYNKEGKPIYQQGDTARGSLHKETFYGAIERTVTNKKGEQEKQIKYVVRKPLDMLENSNLKNIVDDRIREIVTNARNQEKALRNQLEELNKDHNKAEEYDEAPIQDQIEALKKQIDELYVIPSKTGGKPTPIKKVRIFTPTVTNPIHLKDQRDRSKAKTKPYKEKYHVTNDGNHLMAIYEAKDAKGKVQRGFELVNNLDAAAHFKLSTQSVLTPQGFEKLEGLVPKTKAKGKLELPLKAILKIGTMVILWENSPEEVWDLSIAEMKKRTYKVVGLSEQRIQNKYFFAVIVLRHIQEAKPTTDLKIQDGAFDNDELFKPYRKINQNQFNALIEGIDFKISPLGKIEKI